MTQPGPSLTFPGALAHRCCWWPQWQKQSQLSPPTSAREWGLIPWREPRGFKEPQECVHKQSGPGVPGGTWRAFRLGKFSTKSTIWLQAPLPEGEGRVG